MFRSCVAIVLLICWTLTLEGAAAAQSASDRWVMLQTAEIDAVAGDHTIDITARYARASAVKIVVKTGSLNIARLSLNYGNGQDFFDDHPINLQAGESTSIFDARDEEVVLESVSIVRTIGKEDSKQVSNIEIWVRQHLPALRPRGEDSSDASSRGYFEVPVFYGTTRASAGQRVKNGHTIIKFGNDKSSTSLTLGRAIVTVPYDRPPGSINRPEIDFLVARVALRNEDPARDFTIQETGLLSREDFIAAVRRQASTATRAKNQALIFVHGYNVSFDDALFRAAQIAKDVNFDGPIVTFSWRSAGGMWDYRHDIDTAKEAREPLRELLTLIANESGVGNVNLIAHSMGNDPVIEVLHENAEIKRRGGNAQDFKLNEIIFAAPDVSRTIFEDFAGKFSGIAHGGMTLYASNNDVAMLASERVAGGLVRAGEVPTQGILVIHGMESIDISDASTSFFTTNHCAFADRAHLITDMELLFGQTRNKHPPNLRFAVYRSAGTKERQWWYYRRNN
jgi:esterase/lipase superfamily enzyme